METTIRPSNWSSATVFIDGVKVTITRQSADADQHGFDTLCVDALALGGRIVYSYPEESPF